MLSRCLTLGAAVTDDCLLVMTTCDETETARRIAGELVAGRLAACVNIVSGVESVYRWDGEVQQEQEILLLIKTGKSRFTALQDALKRLTGYELPEILAVPVAGGSEDYLNWVRAAVAAE